MKKRWLERSSPAHLIFVFPSHPDFLFLSSSLPCDESRLSHPPTGGSSARRGHVAGMSSFRRSVRSNNRLIISHSCPSLPIDGHRSRWGGGEGSRVSICGDLRYARPRSSGRARKELYVIPDSMSRFTRGAFKPIWDFGGVGGVID